MVVDFMVIYIYIQWVPIRFQKKSPTKNKFSFNNSLKIPVKLEFHRMLAEMIPWKPHQFFLCVLQECRGQLWISPLVFRSPELDRETPRPVALVTPKEDVPHENVDKRLRDEVYPNAPWDDAQYIYRSTNWLNLMVNLSVNIPFVPLERFWEWKEWKANRTYFFLRKQSDSELICCFEKHL